MQRVYICMPVKKFDSLPDAGQNQRMPDPKKQEYYRKNREARLKYQHKYHAEVGKYRVERRKELERELDPELWTLNQESRSRYNREYYRKNRERIRAQRKRLAEERARLKKRVQDRDSGCG